jgi:hypothetical protein
MKIRSLAIIILGHFIVIYEQPSNGAGICRLVSLALDVSSLIPPMLND